MKFKLGITASGTHSFSNASLSVSINDGEYISIFTSSETFTSHSGEFVNGTYEKDKTFDL